MLHRCADGLCSHIFLGNSRNAAHRSAGERPKDSKVLRRSLPMVIGHTYLGHVRRGSPNLAASIALRVFSQISRVATAKVFVETGFVLPPYGGFSRSSIKWLWLVYEGTHSDAVFVHCSFSLNMEIRSPAIRNPVFWPEHSAASYGCANTPAIRPPNTTIRWQIRRLRKKPSQAPAPKLFVDRLRLGKKKQDGRPSLLVPLRKWLAVDAEP